MKKFKVSINIQAESDQKVVLLGNLIQSTINKVDYGDIITLLKKVNQNPSIVKTALKFI